MTEKMNKQDRPAVTPDVFDTLARESLAQRLDAHARFAQSDRSEFESARANFKSKRTGFSKADPR